MIYLALKLVHGKKLLRKLTDVKTDRHYMDSCTSLSLQQVNKKCVDVSKKKKVGITSRFYNASSENVLSHCGTARAESIFLSRELSSLVSFC